MGNGYFDAFGDGAPEAVIPITLTSGKTVYHGTSLEVAHIRIRNALSHETIPGFWRRKK